MERHLSKIEKLAKSESSNIFRGLAYITEELGELAKDLLENKNVHAKQEALYIVLASLGVYYQVGGSNKFLKRHFDKQIKKWSKTLNERKSMD